MQKYKWITSKSKGQPGFPEQFRDASVFKFKHLILNALENQYYAWLSIYSDCT